MLVDLLRKQGVPEKHIVRLVVKEATQSRIKKEFKKFLAQIPSGDFALIYYCGHGFKSDDGKDVFFAPYDAGVEKTFGWPVQKIVERCGECICGVKILIAANCCDSGGLAESGKNSSGGERRTFHHQRWIRARVG